ncbi:hypothetical protein CVP04_01970 [Caviibacterium pharyngocola]|uniref:Uncharacterized protein n=1 Tax=Caviibacterium pharyngocola TaxID=28159 RepID=A0A2M8RYB5_9PAST|nr:hypothetical protein CVP04_01970 [Caviibacterium pharyngocola]
MEKIISAQKFVKHKLNIYKIRFFQFFDPDHTLFGLVEIKREFLPSSEYNFSQKNFVNFINFRRNHYE